MDNPESNVNKITAWDRIMNFLAIFFGFPIAAYLLLKIFEQLNRWSLESIAFLQSRFTSTQLCIGSGVFVWLLVCIWIVLVMDRD